MDSAYLSSFLKKNVGWFKLKNQIIMVQVILGMAKTIEVVSNC